MHFTVVQFVDPPAWAQEAFGIRPGDYGHWTPSDPHCRLRLVRELPTHAEAILLGAPQELRVVSHSLAPTPPGVVQLRLPDSPPAELRALVQRHSGRLA